MRKYLTAAVLLLTAAAVLLWLVFLRPSHKTAGPVGPRPSRRAAERNTAPADIIKVDDLNDLLTPAEDIIRQVREVTQNVIDKKASSQLALSYYREATAFLTDTRVNINHLRTAPEFQETKTRADTLCKEIIAKITDLTYLIKADNKNELKKSLIGLNKDLTAWRNLYKPAAN